MSKQAHQTTNVSRRSACKLGIHTAGLAGVAATAGLAGMFALPQDAWATVEGDQTPLTDAEIDQAIADGLIKTEFPSDKNQSRAAGNFAVITLGGPSRYATNAAQVRYAFEDSEWAIVASGEGYADSICAAGLAGALDCPIVLSEPDHLGDSAATTLRMIGVRHVILLGSTVATSEAVEESLRALVGQSGSVVRLGGTDRYATQMAVYAYGVEHNLWQGDTAVVASAAGFADALSMSPVSFCLKAPVFYVNEYGELPLEQQNALKKCGKSRFLLAGSSTVTPVAVERFLQGLGTTVRLSGWDRYETSRAIANYAVNTLGMSWNNVALTSGRAPYDALGGGPVQGRSNSVLLLTEETDLHTEPSVPFAAARPAALRFFGDSAIFSSAFKARLAMKAGFALSQVKGMRVYLDAGHGGYDPGAVGNGYRECDLTADLAWRVNNILTSQYGMSVYVNVSGNHYRYRHPEARAMDCGILVSLHFNAGGGSGTETYVHSYNSATGSKTLQHAIQSRLVQTLGLSDRGEKAAPYAVTSGPLPSTLVEVCFIDKWGDINRYLQYRDSVAQAIADGIAQSGR